MNDREAFLAAIDEKWDDDYIRLIYADWLEERGEDEEAARMRKWKESKDWLVGFAQRWNFFDCTGAHGDLVIHDEYPWDDDRHYEHVLGKVLSEREIIEGYLAHVKEWEENPEDDFWYLTAEGKDLHHAAELDGDDKLFWEHLEVVSGKKFTDDHKENFMWSCTC